MMYLLNKSIKQFNTLDKILDKKIEKILFLIRMNINIITTIIANLMNGAKI